MRNEGTVKQDWFRDSLLPSINLKWLSEGKRYKALTMLYYVIPDVLNDTPVTAILAPDSGGLYTSAPAAEIIVYLAPDLEIESQEQVNFTVAHEFAHVALAHSFLCWNSEQCKRDEKRADQLAAVWGFERPSEPYKITREMLTVYRDYLATQQNCKADLSRA
jgi:hypothetical protein